MIEIAQDRMARVVLNSRIRRLHVKMVIRFCCRQLPRKKRGQNRLFFHGAVVLGGGSTLRYFAIEGHNRVAEFGEKCIAISIGGLSVSRQVEARKISVRE